MGDKQPSESEPLLLSSRQGLFPGNVFVEAINEMPKPHYFQGFCYFFSVHLFCRHGISDGPQQGAKRNIWTLRDNTHLRPALQLDVALAPWPLTANGSHEGTLSGTGFAN